jgi:hypothetical protein
MSVNRREALLKEAARLQEAAEQTDDPEKRAGLLELAAGYLKLASEASEPEK